MQKRRFDYSIKNIGTRLFLKQLMRLFFPQIMIAARPTI